MSLQGKPVVICDAFTIGTGPIAAVHNLTTLDISKSGTVDFTSAPRVLNFSWPVSAVLKTATMAGGAINSFVNSSSVAASPVLISLDNGGTVEGVSVYKLTSGNPVAFLFDGLNLI